MGGRVQSLGGAGYIALDAVIKGCAFLSESIGLSAMPGVGKQELRNLADPDVCFHAQIPDLPVSPTT